MIEGVVPILISFESSGVSFSAVLLKLSSWNITIEAYSYSSSASYVGKSFFESLLKSLKPSFFSVYEIDLLSAGCDTFSILAAFVIEPSL